MDTTGAAEIPNTRFDEFATEGVLATTALLSIVRATSPVDGRLRAFSRVEAAHNRRARSSLAARTRRRAAAWRWRLFQAIGALAGYFWTAVAWLALRCDSLSYSAPRIAHRNRLAHGFVAALSPAAPILPASNAVSAAPFHQRKELE